MSYYRFTDDDIFINGIETHPSHNFIIYSGSVFYQNRPFEDATVISGSTLTAASGTVLNTPVGSVSLYELNVNRPSILHTWNESEKTGNKALIFPYIVKSSDHLKFKSISTSSYNAMTYGTGMTSSYNYPLSASISRELYPLNHLASALDYSARHNRGLSPLKYNHLNKVKGVFDGGNVTVSSSYIEALKNTFSYYTHLSRHYEFTSSARTKDNTTSQFPNGTPAWDKGVQQINMINVSAMYYGSSVQKGTVDLKFYVSGSLIGRCQDLNKNGELIETTASYATFDADNLKVAGVVLYNEGILALTGTWALDAGTAAYSGNPGSLVSPSWLYWGVGITSSLNVPSETQLGSISKYNGVVDYEGSSERYNLPSASYSLDFSGSQTVPVLTMFAHAPRGELYWSNNPTFTVSNVTGAVANSASVGSTTATTENVISGSIQPVFQGDTFYQEDSAFEIKNINSSSFPNQTASFEKTTYISKIGIYDKQQNLIGVARVSRPLKKRITQDFTFKLKLDI
jgi:hypothetical protein